MSFNAVWAAGLFEGEGCIHIAVRNSDQTYRLVATIAMTDEEVIQFFQEHWPGWFQYKTPPPPRRPVFTWTVAGPRAEAFLKDISPFIRTTRVRDKIAVALAFRDEQRQLGRKAGDRPAQKAIQRAGYDRMHVLNGGRRREVA